MKNHLYFNKVTLFRKRAVKKLFKEEMMGKKWRQDRKKDDRKSDKHEDEEGAMGGQKLSTVFDTVG